MSRMFSKIIGVLLILISPFFVITSSNFSVSLIFTLIIFLFLGIGYFSAGMKNTSNGKLFWTSLVISTISIVLLILGELFVFYILYVIQSDPLATMGPGLLLILPGMILSFIGAILFGIDRIIKKTY